MMLRNALKSFSRSVGFETLASLIAKPLTACGERHMPNLEGPTGTSKGLALLQEGASDSSTEEEPEDRTRALAYSSDILAHQCQNRVALKQDGHANAMPEIAGQ